MFGFSPGTVGTGGHRWDTALVQLGPGHLLSCNRLLGAKDVFWGQWMPGQSLEGVEDVSTTTYGGFY